MTRRLEEIVSEIPRCGCLADVGCDHGIVALEAVRRGLCDRLVITDISRQSLSKAEKLLGQAGIEFESYCCDGLSGVPHEVDCCVICGMGGYEIMSVLDAVSPQFIVLQPMRDTVALRLYLSRCGYFISTDRIVKSDGKFYDVIAAERIGGETLSEERLLFGRNAESFTEDFAEYLRTETGKRLKLLPRVPEGRRREIEAWLCAAARIWDKEKKQ